MKNILITGGAGFIGSNLAFELSEIYPQADITLVDDFRSGDFKNLLNFKHDVLAYDVCDKELFNILSRKKFDTIFHQAAITDTTILDQRKMMYDNVEGFRNIIELALNNKAVLVYASSAGTYGSKDESIKEEDAGSPNNIYGFSKWIMDNIAMKYKDRLKIVGLRYFNVFGPKEAHKGHASSMIYQLCRQMQQGKRPRIFKMGEQKRDFVYVKDVVSANIAAAHSNTSTIANIGTGSPTSFNELIDYLNEALQTDLKPDYFDNPYDFYQNFTQADLSHTKKALKWQPQFTTRQGVLDYVKSYLKKE